MAPSLPAILNLGWGELVFAVVAVFLAAIVRGYSGFGFSALVVVSLSLVMAPVRVVPVLLILEIVASIRLLPSAWRQIDWHSLRWLLLGSAISIPMGVYLLASVPDEAMRVLVSVLVLGASLLIWKGYGFHNGGSTGLTLGTGLVSGAMNGAAAVGGLAVVVMFLSTFMEMAAARATLIALLFSTDAYALALAGGYGLVTGEVVLRAGLFLAPLFAGIGVGKRCFGRTTPETFRRFVLVLLMGLSLVGLGRAVVT